MLVRGMVEGGVPRAIRHHWTAPVWRQHIHIRGASFDFEFRLPTVLTNGLEKGLHEGVTFVRFVCHFVAEEVQRGLTGLLA